MQIYKKIFLTSSLVTASLLIVNLKASASSFNPESTLPGFGGESSLNLIPGFDTSINAGSSIPGFDDTVSSIPGLGGGTDQDQVTTYFVDQNNNQLSAPVDGMQMSVEIPGYKLLSTTLVDNIKWVHVYIKVTDADNDNNQSTNKTTTINFTAKYNDGRPDAHYSWTFPENTKVTYGQLFAMAGLDLNDFNF